MVLRAANSGVDVEAGEQQGAFCGSLLIREDGEEEESFQGQVRPRKLFED